jgi:AcrR family transcriptional regulator
VAAVSGGRAVRPRGATKAKLIESTIALLQSGGYANASVAAITERSGVAAGTLYRHYPSKEALFVEVFRSVCERELAAMTKAAAEHDEFERRLDAVVAVFSRRALRNPRLAWALIAEPVDPLVDVERLEFRHRYRDLMAGLLLEAIRQGRIPEQDADLTAAALVGAIGEALVGPLSPVEGGGAPAEHVIDALIVFCRRSFGAALTYAAAAIAANRTSLQRSRSSARSCSPVSSQSRQVATRNASQPRTATRTRSGTGPLRSSDSMILSTCFCWLLSMISLTTGSVP